MTAVPCIIGVRDTGDVNLAVRNGKRREGMNYVVFRENRYGKEEYWTGEELVRADRIDPQSSTFLRKAKFFATPGEAYEFAWNHPVLCSKLSEWKAGKRI